MDWIWYHSRMELTEAQYERLVVFLVMGNEHPLHVNRLVPFWRAFVIKYRFITSTKRLFCNDRQTAHLLPGQRQ